MTAYVANHEKKLRLFEKREQELLHAIRHGFSIEKLLVAAEKLRAAKISVYKCRFSANSEIQPRSFSLEDAAAKKPALQKWVSMSADEIVELYRRK